MTDTKPKEQIEILQGIMGRTTGIEALVNPDMLTDILASLEELAAIKSQPVPVEPYIVKQDRVDNVVRTFTDTRLKYIDSLQSALQRAQQERDEWENKAGQYMDERDKAEVSNKRLVELLNDSLVSMEHAKTFIASKEKMSDTGLELWSKALKSMSAELLREAGK